LPREAHLQELESQRHAQLSELEQARLQRSQVLANLQVESRNRVQTRAAATPESGAGEAAARS